MLFGQNCYRVLVVSASEKFNNEIRGLLPPNQYDPPDAVMTLAQARQALQRHVYDFVIINTPLPDGYGTELAADIGRGRDCVALILEKPAVCEEKSEERTAEGLFSLSKPTTGQMILQALRWMAAARSRLRQFANLTARAEEKTSEVRLVSRAKCLLMEKEKLTEKEAHRYIEKQAMDRCITRGNIAREIIGRLT